MKKILLRFTALLLSVCCLLAAAAPAFAVVYTDVGSLSTEYRDAINYLGDNGLMVGTSSTQFSPDQELNRAMAVSLLYRLSGDTTKYSSSFPDVASGSYYYYAVGWGVAKGIVYGHTDGKFHPYDTLSLQDFCTFLYRYAKQYNSGSTRSSDTVNLSSASDYSNISSYAVEAMSWFFSWGLKDRKDTKAALYPKSTVVRKDAALFLHRYRLNAEGIVFGRDNFSFLNTSGNFISGTTKKYSMSYTEYNRLKSFANKYGSGVSDMLDKKLADNIWDGSCYGMSIALLLDYLGKTDMNGTLCSNTPTMYSVPSLSKTSSPYHRLTTIRGSSTKISNMESFINMYQMSQYIMECRSDAWSIPTDSNTVLHNVIDQLGHGGIGLLTMRFNRNQTELSSQESTQSDYYSYGHAVIAYGKATPSQNCTAYTGLYCLYHVNIWDPNESNPEILHIGWDIFPDTYSGVILGRTHRYDLDECQFTTDLTPANTIRSSNVHEYPWGTELTDPDSIDLGESILDTHSILSVQATQSFTITNATGQYLRYSDSILSGDLPIYGTKFLVTGSSSPCELLFLVDSSESYACQVDEGGQLLSFSYVSRNEYQESSSNSPSNHGQPISTATLILGKE